MFSKWLLVFVAVLNPVIAQNMTSIPRTIFDNYKKGASQFISVIDYLIAGIGTAKPVEWAQQLQNNVKAFPVPFQASLTESESEKAKLDQFTVKLVARSSELDTQISQLQSTIGANQVLVSSNENQVSLASQHVQDAENSLASSERALEELQGKLGKAQNDCFGRRRKRRGLQGGGGIQKILCPLISAITGSIGRATNQRNDARGVRDNAVNVLNARRGESDVARQRLASSQQQLANKQSELTSVNQQLNGVRAQIVAIGVVNQELKSVIEHIDKIVVGSTVLKRFVDDLSLLDLNTLIKPLEQIGDELTKTTPGTETLKFPTLSQEQITSIRNNLKTLSNQLPNEAVISNNVTNVA